MKTMNTISIVIIAIIGTSVVRADPSIDARVIERMQYTTMCQLHDALQEEDAEKALILSSTMTQLQAIEINHLVTELKRAALPRPEVAVPQIKNILLTLLESELDSTGYMDIINAVTSDMSASQMGVQVGNAAAELARASAAKSDYTARAYALAEAMDDKYGWSSKPKPGSDDWAAVKSLVDEGKAAGYSVPYVLKSHLK